MLSPVRTEDFAADPQDSHSFGTALRDLAVSILVVAAAALIASFLTAIA
ncbi:hypothetical protein WKW80_26010 [Variovorax humicola]|uniref:Uncharacterized protein n=1 Tax=Variovorax humicola TaxID=1769758 RepID=A0ABU8W5X2_9BURK